MDLQPSSPSIIETSDPEEFGARIGEYARRTVRVDPVSAQDFRSRTRAWRLPRIGLFMVRVDRARVYSPPSPGVLSLTVALEGFFEGKIRSARKSVDPGTCFAPNDSDALDLQIPRASMLAANLDTQLLRETARKLGDAEPTREDALEPRFSLATQEGALLWRRLAAIWRDLRGGAPLLDSPRAVAEAEAGLAEAVVDAVGAVAADRAGDCGAVYLRRAEEFILAHLRDPISRADICAAAKVSARSLSRQFVHRHAIGPMTFLKQRRLEAAQRSLLAADPAERSVTDVAMEWGLYHLGRFSVEYRAAFGEPPSRTLGR